MATILIEGFDKYINTVYLTLGEWTSFTGNSPAFTFVTGAYGGSALQFTNGFGTADLHRTLPNNYATLIVGMRLKNDLAQECGFKFLDAGTLQLSVTLDTTGRFRINSGFGAATSVAAVTANTWHYVELKVKFHGTLGTYDLYLDGVNILSAINQNTKVTANAFAGEFRLFITNLGFFDDLYLFDDTGSFNNAPRGDSIVETQFPNGDSLAQFTIGAAALGALDALSTHNLDVTGIILRPYTPKANCMINSVSFIPNTNSGSAKFKAALFADSAGVAGSRLSDGVEVVSCIAGTILTTNLVTPTALVAGTQYWIGYLTDTNINVYRQNALTLLGYVATATYGSGVPLTAPVMIGGQSSWTLWGDVTATTNFTEVTNFDNSPVTILPNYLTNTAIGDEDLYTFPPLATIPLSIAAIKVSTFCQKTDAGARNIDLRTKSGVTDDPGNNPNQPVIATFSYLSSIWDNDPDTGLVWDESSVNNATSGVKVST